MAKPPVDYLEKTKKQFHNKKKKHKGVNEDSVLENRKNRVNFKNYIRQLREEEAETDFDDYED